MLNETLNVFLFSDTYLIHVRYIYKKIDNASLTLFFAARYYFISIFDNCYFIIEKEIYPLIK